MADFTVKDWMEEESAAQRETIALDMAGTMDLGLLEVTPFLQDLQPYLNNDATQIQAAEGMELLSKVLTYAQADLGRADIHAVTQYLCERLENKDDILNFQAGVKWNAHALKALAKMTARFPRGDASVVAKAAFKLASTSFREQLPATRLAVFELLNFLLGTYSATLTRDMGAQSFVEGLVNLAEFEKDPRCLKVLFQMYQEISQDWTLQPHSFKLMWDSYSRYFPITLKTTDTSVPGREELQLLLIGCFASNDAYATHALPHLLEGLDTSEDTLTAYVKNTVLETFEACVNAFSIEVAAEWSPKVFDALKFEVWDGSNDEFIERSLKVIHAIGQKLDNGNLDWEDHTSPFAQYILTTSTECTRRLHDSKIQHVLGSGKLLHAVASSSSFGFYLVIKNVLPKLDVIWNDLKSKDKKIALLSVFNDILQARLDLRDGLNIALSQGHGLERYSASSEARLTTALAGYQQLMVEDVLINAMMETDSGEHAIDTPYKVNAIKGLVVGARIPGFLSDYHKGTVILEFSKLAANKSQSDEIHAELVKALQQISIEDVTRFRDLTLPTFTAELPDLLRSSKAEFTEQMNNSIFILESLTEIACTAACKVELSKPAARRGTSFKFRVFEEFQEALLKKFDAVLQIPNQLYYANAILAAVYRGLQLFDDVLEKDEAGGDFQPSPLPAIRSLQLIEDVSEKEDSNDVQSSRVPEVGPYDWIIIGLYQKLVCQKAHQSGPLAKLHHMGLKVNLQDPKDSDLFVGLLGRITTLILRSSQTTPMNNFLFNNEKEGQPSQIWYIFCVEPPTESIEISQQNLEFGPAEKGLMNVLSMSLVAGIRRDDKERLKIHVGTTALAMIKNAISTATDCSAYARISMLHFLQLLVNKFGAAKERIENEEGSLVQIMLNRAANSLVTSDELEIQHTYQTLAYFTAACLATGDGAVKDLISQMVSGIGHPVVGRKVAQSFRILLAPSEVMIEQNFCVMRKLRKQRLYHLSVDKIIAMWRESTTKELKNNYLIALAGVFAFMEPKILEDNAEKIFPLILEGTNVDDDHTMHTFILLIRALVIACPEVAATHIDSIINRMTDRTHNTYESPSDASVKCRAAALKVLSLLVSHMERRVVLRRKAKIMVELDVALDDCSRTIRSAAERTKMRWFNLLEADA